MENETNRRDFIKLAVGAACTGLVESASATPIAASHKLEPFQYSGVRLLDSRLKDQYRFARDFYFNLSDDSLLLGFRQRAGLPAPGKPLVGWYGGAPSGPGQPDLCNPDMFNTFGQYVSGMARISKATNDQAMREKASNLIDQWSRTIEPDGFFYYSRNPYSAHYIYEKTVGGLVDLYEYGSDAKAIDSLERISAWAEKNLDRSRRIPLQGVGPNADGQEWYTLSENLYRAYLLTGDERYRRFGDLWRYDNYWGMFNGKVPLDPYGRHAYSHVNTFSSAAMTYAVTSDPQHLETLVNAYEWLQRTQVYATGGFGPAELLLAPDGSLGRELETNGETFETVCGSWAIFKMSRYLIAFTGEARYGDWIERAVYNGIGAALPMQPDGRNFYYSDYRMGGGRKIYNPQWKWSCCSGTYPQAIADYHNLIYFHDQQGLYVNLYIPSEVEWKGIKVRQETDYPEGEISQFTIQTASPVRMPLRFRIPGWCHGASVAINGVPQGASCAPGSWATVDRTWTQGDRATIHLPMEPVFMPVDAQHPKRVAVACGPVVLVRRQNGALTNALQALQRSREGLAFRAQSVREDDFVPFYAVGFNEPYEMYFDLT